MLPRIQEVPGRHVPRKVLSAEEYEVAIADLPALA
jgi:hypothetical protein